MNDALAEAMTAAGYRKVGRALAPVRSTPKLIRENGELRKQIVELKAANQRLVSELAAARSNGEAPPPLLKTILQEVSEKHEVPIAVLQGDRRNRAAVYARHEYCWRACNETGKSLPDIGRLIYRDHTTVLHARRRHEERRKQAEGGAS